LFKENPNPVLTKYCSKEVYAYIHTYPYIFSGYYKLRSKLKKEREEW
jgi:hypothetical protein